MNFDNIEYLKHGTDRQRQAYFILNNIQILSKLKSFDPILVGTIPLSIDIESSDLDIICCFSDNHQFQKTIIDNFANEDHFKIREQHNINGIAIVANFFISDFEIEVFGQTIPSKQQFGYRHLVVEYNLLNNNDERFRQQIIELKHQGHKTESAFASVLGLTGDPYIELLRYEGN
ncbi:DUF4269 domain-containing protein [Flavobacterium limi]|uniref:Alpha/beta hydrolase n=1 Tax=Flavobacterium limi TaxID=2045105 RepID=A0ABQ1U0L3_9FLAO|nr:DUF4269 domain-containing protein [Flavobacterium limi]GGF06345.1 alpha/beta hydrolase [Flavobacterium limi]